MGGIFGGEKKQEKSQASIDYENQMKADKIAEDKRAADAAAAVKEKESKTARGLIGSRSLFGNSGGRGYFEGK